MPKGRVPKLQNMIKVFKKLPIASLAAVLLPVLALAQVIPPATPITSFQEILNVVNTLLSWIFTIFFIIAAIVIIFAAFNYLTAGGDEEKINKAKQQLIYAIVAIAVALVARGIEFVVEELVTS